MLTMCKCALVVLSGANKTLHSSGFLAVWFFWLNIFIKFIQMEPKTTVAGHFQSRTQSYVQYICFCQFGYSEVTTEVTAVAWNNIHLPAFKGLGAKVSYQRSWIIKKKRWLVLDLSFLTEVWTLKIYHWEQKNIHFFFWKCLLISDLFLVYLPHIWLLNAINEFSTWNVT